MSTNQTLRAIGIGALIAALVMVTAFAFAKDSAECATADALIGIGFVLASQRSGSLLKEDA